MSVLDFIYVLPDGKGGMTKFSSRGRVRKPAPYEPWRKEWQFKGALAAHASCHIRWLYQKIARLEAANKRLKRGVL